MDRITSAVFTGTAANAYDETVSYDKMGNILTFLRKGRLDSYIQSGGTKYGLIDNLTYNYSGNRLIGVSDVVNNQVLSDVMEFRKGTTNTYTYDASGRVTADFNKNINKIEYNYLNLPQRIEFQNGNRIEYAYDASGVKCRTKHYTAAGGTTITTEYVENKVYINGALDKIQIEGGYIAKKGTTYNRYYYVKDHQGNNRVVLNMAGGIVQATNYYPFGLSFAEVPARVGQQVQSFKFNGKELDRMFGVDTYDYSARMYSPAIGRFMTMDPLAEKYYSISPYVYCANNPVKFIDPDGKKIRIAGSYNYNSIYTKIYSFIAPYSYVGKVNNQLNQLRSLSKELDVEIQRMDDSNKEIMIQLKVYTSEGYKKGNFFVPLNKENGSMQYDPDNDIVENNKETRPSIVGLAHELGHASDFVNGIIYKKEDKMKIIDQNESVRKEGVRVIESKSLYFENKVRDALKIKKRTSYGNTETYNAAGCE